jgi:hypothetical protein
MSQVRQLFPNNGPRQDYSRAVPAVDRRMARRIFFTPLLMFFLIVLRVRLPQFRTTALILYALPGLLGTTAVALRSRENYMRPIEEYLKHVDDLAQEVVNVWGMYMQSGNNPLLTDAFNDLLDKACRYRTIKIVADTHRQFGVLSKSFAAEEEETRRVFAQAYQDYREKKQRAA